MVLHDIVSIGENQDDGELIFRLLTRQSNRKTGYSIIYYHQCEQWSHIHVIHDCNWSSTKCACAILTGIRVVPRRTYKSIRSVTDTNSKFWRNLFHYFSQKQQGNLYIKIQKDSTRIPLYGVENLSQALCGEAECLEELCSRHPVLDQSKFNVSEPERGSFTEIDSGKHQRDGQIEIKSRKSIIPRGKKVFESVEQFLMSNLFVPMKNCVLDEQYLNLYSYTVTENLLQRILHNVETRITKMSFVEIQKWVTNQNPNLPIQRVIFKSLSTFEHYYLSIEETENIVKLWLEYQFNQDFESIGEFLTNLYRVLDRNNEKCCVIYLYGDPNSLKSTFFTMIADAFINVGYCSKNNKLSQFGLQDCYNKRVVIIDDPSFDRLAIEQMKSLFSGDAINVSVKFKGDCIINKTAFLMASNNELFQGPVWESRIYRKRVRDIRHGNLPWVSKKLNPLYTYKMFGDYGIL